jgi:hypothetical protein
MHNIQREDNWRKMNWKGCGRKRSQSNFIYSPRIYQEGLATAPNISVWTPAAGPRFEHEASRTGRNIVRTRYPGGHTHM